MLSRFCGNQNKEDASSCEECGKNLNESALVSQPKPELVFKNRVAMAIKQIASSPVFLAATIIFTIYTILGILKLDYNGIGLKHIIYFFDSLVDMWVSWDIYGFFDQFGVLQILVGILYQLPNIILAAGLWVVYCTAKRKKPPFVKVSAFTTVERVQWINLVIAGIITLVIYSMFILAIIEDLSRSRSNVDEAGITVYFLLLSLVIPGAVILYYVKIIASLKNIKNAFKTGADIKKPSLYIGIFLIISIISNIYFSLFNASFLFFNIAELIISLIHILIIPVMNVLFAIVFFKARNILKKI